MDSSDILFEPTPEFIAILHSELQERNGAESSLPPRDRELALLATPGNQSGVRAHKELNLPPRQHESTLSVSPVEQSDVEMENAPRVSRGKGKAKMVSKTVHYLCIGC